MTTGAHSSIPVLTSFALARRCTLSCLIMVAVLTTPRPAMASAPDCPGARTLQLSGNLARNGTETIIPVEMYPCETFTADFQFTETSPGTDRWAFGSLVSHYGASDYSLNSYSWRISSSASGAMPATTEQTPFNGALGNYLSVIRKIKLWSDTPSDPNDTSTVAYAVTIHLVPRPGYNEADTTMKKAGGPVFDNAAIKVSMAGSGLSSVWSYYRVSLAPGGTLYLTGTLDNRNPSFAANLVAQVFNDSEQYQTQLFNKSVSASSTDSLPNPTTTFTNPSSTQVRDFYIGFNSSQSARLYSGDITVHAGSYAPNCNCKPAFNGSSPAWYGTRTVRISTSFNAEDKAAILEGISAWNARLAQLSIPITFDVTTGAADVNVVADANNPGGGWAESLTTPSTGIGAIAFYSGTGPTAYLGQGRGNLVTHVMMHELGHALDLDDLPVNTPSCSSRDAVMWDTVNISGPFPGITCADCAAATARP